MLELGRAAILCLKPRMARADVGPLSQVCCCAERRWACPVFVLQGKRFALSSMMQAAAAAASSGQLSLLLCPTSLLYM